MSSLGELTTIFTPSPSCFASTNIWQVWQTGSKEWYEILGAPSASGCMPPNYKQENAAFYSPGRCPDGFSVASSQTTTVAATVTETTQVCCPTAYSFTVDQPSELPSDPFSSILCRSEWGPSTSLKLTKTVPGEEASAIETMVVGGWLRAQGVVVKFQAEDFETKTPTSGTPSSSSNGQSSTSAISASSGGDGGGLGTGASIGVGVAVGIIGLALIIGGVWFLLWSRKKKRAGAVPYAHLGASEWREVPEWRPPPQGPPQELPATTKYAHELSPYAPPQELEVRH